MKMTKLFQNLFMGFFLLISVIGIGFAGMNSNVVDKVAPGNVIVADGRSITKDQFKRLFERQLEQMGQRGQQVTQEQAIAQGYHNAFLQSLAGQESTMAWIQRLGVKPGLALIGERMKQMTAFFDEVSGQFDPKKYRQLLADNGLTEAQFQQQLSDDISREHLLSAIGAGLKSPRTITALESIRATQIRDVSYFFLTAAAVEPPPAPTDEQLNTLIHDSGVTTPELRAMTIVRFSTAKALPGATADPAQIQRLIDFHKTEQTKPEKRTVIQIVAKDQAQAQTIATRLKGGEDPQAVATALHATLTRFDDKPKSAIADRKVADAAFALATGAVSTPIQGELGSISVVKVTAVTPGQEPDMVKLRADAEVEARRMAASAKISEASDKLMDAVGGGEEMVAAAHRLGADVVTVPLVDAHGMQLDKTRPAGVSDAVLAQAFQLSANEVSDVGQEGEGEFFAVRVDKIEPSVAMPLERIRAEVTEAWRLNEIQKRLEAKATELAGKVRQGQTMEAVAAAAGLSVQHINGVTQANAQDLVKTQPEAVISNAFGARKGQVFSAGAPLPPTHPGGLQTPRMFVGRLENVHSPDAPAAAQMSRRADQGVMELLQDQLQSGMTNASRSLIKPQVNQDRAARALGIEAPAPGGAAPKAKAKEK